MTPDTNLFPLELTEIRTQRNSMPIRNQDNIIEGPRVASALLHLTETCTRTPKIGVFHGGDVNPTVIGRWLVYLERVRLESI
jgi:hypothetical protein